MKVVASNCGCCAVKHIRDFTEQPHHKLYRDNEYGHEEDTSTSSPPAYEKWDNPIDDKMSGLIEAEEYFRALVAQIKERRPAGIITLNLVSNAPCLCEEGCCSEEFDTTQPDSWRPILTELGFSEVTTLNSNSGNRIHHFTLVYDEGNWVPE